MKNFKVDPTTEEPLFALRGSRRLAPFALRILASLERGHFGMAEQFVRDAIVEAQRQRNVPDADYLETLACSDAMESWWREHRTASAAGHAARSAAAPTPRSESTDTPNAGTAAA